MWLRNIILLICAVFNLATASPTPTNNTAAQANPHKKPKPACVSKHFDKPWILRDIFVWQPLPTPNKKKDKKNDSTGNIDFIFCDENKGLNMWTECNSNLVDGVAENGGGYIPCRNTSVAFKYTKDREIMVERLYIDPCLGEFPYNSGIAFGQNGTDMVTRTRAGFGVVGIQHEMLVPITAMS